MAIGNMRKIVKIGHEIPWVLADKHRVRQTDGQTDPQTVAVRHARHSFARGSKNKLTISLSLWFGMWAYLSIYLFIFIDSCETNYLKIYRTDFRQICRVGRTVAVGPRWSIGNLVRSLKGRCHGNQFCWFSTDLIRWTKTASLIVFAKGSKLCMHIYPCELRVMAQPGGLTYGFGLHLVWCSFEEWHSDLRWKGSLRKKVRGGVNSDLQRDPTSRVSIS